MTDPLRYLHEASSYVVKNIDKLHHEGDDPTDWLRTQVNYYEHPTYKLSDYTKTVLTVIKAILERLDTGMSIEELLELEKVKSLLLKDV